VLYCNVTGYCCHGFNGTLPLIEIRFLVTRLKGSIKLNADIFSDGDVSDYLARRVIAICLRNVGVIRGRRA